MPKDGGIGASTTRREDVRFLTGEGNYTSDINAYGQVAAIFVRSNVANGVISRIGEDGKVCLVSPQAVSPAAAKVMVPALRNWRREMDMDVKLCGR